MLQDPCLINASPKEKWLCANMDIAEENLDQALKLNLMPQIPHQVSSNLSKGQQLLHEMAANWGGQSFSVLPGVGRPFTTTLVLQRQEMGFPCPIPPSERGHYAWCSAALLGLVGLPLQRGGAGLHSCSTAPAACRAGACFAQKKNPLPFVCIAERKIKPGRQHCFPSSLFPSPCHLDLWASPLFSRLVMPHGASTFSGSP